MQRKVPADILRPQGYIPPSLLHKGRKDELNMGDEDLDKGLLKSLEWFSNRIERGCAKN